MIHPHTHTLFLRYAAPLETIVELGDQLMDIGQETQFMRSDEYYCRHGLKIITVDIHGKNRAIPIDLSQESKKVFQADLLTDFGTVEHVSDLYNALLNCHNWTKTGGVMIHANPKTGTYAGHGVSFFTEKFWEVLAKACDYKLIEVGHHAPYSDENPDKEVFCVMQKIGNEPFIAREAFQKLSYGTVFNA